MKWKKNLLLSSFSFLALISTVGCQSQAENLASGKKLEEVLLSTNQTRVYPLVQALRKLVPLYNRLHQNDADFLKVTLETGDDNSLYSSEATLTNVIANRFEILKANPQAQEIIPNLIIGSPTNAYALNAYRRILDLDTSKIKRSLFNEKIVAERNILSGAKRDDDNLFSIPFDLTNTDSLVFNLEIMAKIFATVEKGGGRVDHQSQIYQKAQAAAQEGVGHRLPKTKAWANIEPKSKSIFHNLVINDDTFSTIEAIYRFSSDLYQGLKFNTDNITEPTSATVLAIDYQEDVFKKHLASLINDPQSQTFKYLWSLKANSQNQDLSKTINFDFLKDQALTAKLKDLFELYKKTIKQKVIKKHQAKKQFFKTLEFMSNQNQWASWKIRTFDTAIAFAAAVGVNQAADSALARKFFGGKDPAKSAQNWSAFADLDWRGQIFQANQKSAAIYDEGGSSLVAIRSGDRKRDQATLKFLNWLYTAKIDSDQAFNEDGSRLFSQDTKGQISVAWAILELSGYIMPIKELVNEKTVSKISTKIKELNNSLKTLKRSDKRFSDYEAKRNALQAALVSLVSLLKFVSPELNLFNSRTHNDARASQISAAIKNDLLSRTNDNGKLDLDSQTSVDNLKKIAQRQR